VRGPGVLKNWIDTGFLPAVRIGRRVRIKRADFDRLVEQGSGVGAPRESPNIWAGDLPEPDLPDS
jgi:hypothetical protein